MDFTEARREVLNKIGEYDSTPYKSKFGLFVGNEEDKQKVEDLLEEYDEFEASYLSKDFVKVYEDGYNSIPYIGKFYIENLGKFKQILDNEGILYFFCGYFGDYKQDDISIDELLILHGRSEPPSTKILTPEEIIGKFILGGHEPHNFDSLPTIEFGETKLIEESYVDSEGLCFRTVNFITHGVKFSQQGYGEGHNSQGYDEWNWGYNFEVVD